MIVNCSDCGWKVASDVRQCPLCGKEPDGGWSREPEAQAYDDLKAELEENESLLAATRGRAVISPQPRSFASWFGMGGEIGNLGVTPSRLIYQTIRSGTGDAVSGGTLSFDRDSIESLIAEDADPFADGRCTRLKAVFKDGKEIRLRAFGRFGKMARSCAKAWPIEVSHVNDLKTRCAGCGKGTSEFTRFCPFCGVRREEVL